MGLSYKVCKCSKSWGAPQLFEHFFLLLKNIFYYGQLPTTHRCFFKAT